MVETVVQDLRKSGIDIIGDVPWGTHFCQFYEAGADLLDILVPYFRAGLENNEFCMWVTAEPVGVADAQRAMREAVPDFQRYLDSGQLEIIPYSEWYTKDGGFDSQRVLNGWVEKLNAALARGYDGLRLTGNTFWLEKRDWRDFADYERAIDNVIGRYRMVALCTYSVAKCGVSEVADVVSNHQFALIKRQGKWEAIESAERKRAEAELRVSEAKYRSLFENMPDSFAYHEVLFDEENRPIDYVFLEVNDSFERQTGLRREDIIGRRVTEVIPGIAESSFNWIATYGKVALTGEVIRFEQYSEPLERWYSVVAFSPTTGRFSTGFSDITERKRAEEERERLLARERGARQRSANILESITDAFFALDNQWRFTYLNSQAEALLRRKREDLVGKSVWDEFPEAVGSTFYQQYDQAVAEQVSVTFEEFYPPFDTWFHVRAYPSSEGLAVYFEDINQRKQAEEERERLLGEVQSRAAELDAVNKELEAFAYSVSHDLRAPLRAIDGFSKVLLEDYCRKLDEEGASYLRLVREGSQRMARLIDDLLKLSRVTRAEMRRERVDLSNLASVIAAELRKAEPERQVEFRIMPGLVAHGDPQLLRLVLDNLLRNAWKFTSKHPTARIELGATQREGKMVHFVRDDGAGFDTAYANQLFGAFRRLHNEKEFPGTGIGLATVQRVIRRHGGQVWAEGEVEKGATFYFTL